MSQSTSISPFILTIDDEPAITDSLIYSLSKAGFQVYAAHSLADANRVLQESDPQGTQCELILLDLILPDGHGFDWLRQFRMKSSTPVIILSSHDDEIEHIVGLEIGADDYIDKPFSPREVVARIRAILRRVSYGREEGREEEQIDTNKEESDSHLNTNSSSIISQIQVNQSAHEIRIKGQVLTLSKLEYELFIFFYSHPQVVFSRKEVLKHVWGRTVMVNERTVDVHVKTLRKKLSVFDLPTSLIETIRGVGYKFNPECTYE